MTILHIDDDADTRLLLREWLAEAAGGEGPPIQVLEAAGLEDALARHGRLRPQAILLDNRLNAVSGVDLVPHLRAMWKCPVWILTGLPSEWLFERSRRSGASGVLSKDEILKDPRRLRDVLVQCSQVSR